MAARREDLKEALEFGFRKGFDLALEKGKGADYILERTEAWDLMQARFNARLRDRKRDAREARAAKAGQ